MHVLGLLAKSTIKVTIILWYLAIRWQNKLTKSLAIENIVRRMHVTTS